MAVGYDWDDKVTVTDDAFVVLPDGIYPFVVKDFERGRVKNGKNAGANQAVYTLHVTRPDNVTADIQYRLPLIDSMVWKASAFFKAIGAVKAEAGEQTTFPWDGVVGMKGRCELSTREWTNDEGKTYKNNDVDRVLPATGDTGYGDL